MKIAIIGGGAAGLMAASGMSEGADVTVFEKNEKAGKKIYITGKGRCNFTNDCEPNDFLQSVTTNPKFLYSSIYGFTPKETIAFFEANGCRAKKERGGRVFPLSDKASDVTKALLLAAERAGAKIAFNKRITKVERCSLDSNQAECFRLHFSEGESLCFDRVLIASGGKSYPSTGSTGEGYEFAKSLGHTIVEPKPALVSLILRESVKEIEGLSLKNVEAEITCNGKKHKEFGEMIFTARGVSGPIILTLSSRFAACDLGGARLSINLKPALSSEALDKRVLRDFSEFSNKQLKNALDKLLPKSLISYIIDYAKLDPLKPINLISKQERLRLTNAISCLSLTVAARAGFEEAIITSGGVSVKEINPSTMESKLVKGLYFAGEVIDVDALTGGFNLQIAFSTAATAAKAITRQEN